MAGIIHKIEEKLGMGDDKHGDVHKSEHSHGEHKAEHSHGEHKPEHGHGEHKEGIVEKMKDKIHGEDGEHKDGEKKKKKKKKEKKEGHEHGNSSSDSDSD